MPVASPIFYFLLFYLLWSQLTARFGNSLQRLDPPIAIPEIAKLCGVQIGLHTMRHLERQLGHGLIITGGHPQGARLWRSKYTGWVIYADGFDYPSKNTKQGAVIDVISISNIQDWMDIVSPKQIPLVPVPRKQLSLLGSISLGMVQSEVVQRIKKKFPMAKVKDNVIICRSRGFVRVNRITTYQTWVAKIRFKGGRVSKITVYCE